MYTEKELFEIISKFETATEAVSIKAMGPGFINDTLTVATRPDASGKAARYILQRKNHNVFPDVPGMMRNIAMVTEHLRKKVIAAGGDPDREVLKVIRRKPESMSAEEKAAQGGDLYYKDARGNYWAVSLFIEGSVTYEKADSPALAYKGGEGIGKFQSMLADFTQPLNETIKGFHNIRWRFEQWDESVRKNAAGRVKDLAEEIGADVTSEGAADAGGKQAREEGADRGEQGETDHDEAGVPDKIQVASHNAVVNDVSHQRR